MRLKLYPDNVFWRHPFLSDSFFFSGASASRIKRNALRR